MPQHPGPAVPPIPLSTSAGPFRDLQQPQVNGATSHGVLCIKSAICGRVQARPWGRLDSCFERELFPRGCPAPEDTGATTSDPRPRATISQGPKPVRTHLDADLPSIRLHVALLSQKVCFARIPFSKLKIYWMPSVRQPESDRHRHTFRKKSCLWHSNSVSVSLDASLGTVFSIFCISSLKQPHALLASSLHLS